MNESDRHHFDLDEFARQAMIDRDMLPDFSTDVNEELSGIQSAPAPDPDLRDLRQLLWCSIDNDDSRDLDQLSVAEQLPAGQVRIYVAVADVDGVVKKGTAIDDHARHNTTSVYTAARIFPMLPEKLSTDITSLNQDEERQAMVSEMVVNEDGTVASSEIYRALVFNRAKLAYNAVDAWLDGRSEAPAPLAAIRGLDENIRLQSSVAQKMRERRHELGALDLETIEPRAVRKDGRIVDLELDLKNEPKELIEDFMIAANGAAARFLESRKFASLRRVVRVPKRWDRIVAVAEEYGEHLPADPDASALEEFLLRRRKADALRFPDLSLTIVKLLGSGEYVVTIPGSEPVGHFGLAVRDYSHSTAPNRRFPDLITHRLLKAALAGDKPPYSIDELRQLAEHCTEKEDDAAKVERLVAKSAAAVLLAPRINERFDGVVTGASEKGTWVRIFRPPVEGKIIHGWEGLDVGDKARVKLVGTNPEKGFIDFVRTGK
ncbi:MAG: RNB domain-containing ribonuclease [Acidobacteriota bacterium]